MGLRRRLERLEARIPPPAPLRSGGPSTLDEIRALEADIRRLEAEIRAEGGTVEPEPDEVFPVDLEAIVREIERLEREELEDLSE